MARYVQLRHGKARFGTVWQARYGMVGQGEAVRGLAWCDMTWHGKAGKHIVKNKEVIKMVYSFKNKGFFHVDAQVAGEVCEKLEQTVGLSAETLLDASRPEDAPLHDEFEWDDEVAAEGYRRYQAGNIIRNLEIVIEEQEPTRAFVTIERQVAHSSVYEPTVQVMKEEDKRKSLLELAKIELSWFKKKYKGLQELSKIMQDIEELEAQR